MSLDKNNQNLLRDKVYLLDGAYATELFKLGAPRNSCLEKWIVNNPDKLESIQKQYIIAGANIITSPTFGANRGALASYGEEENLDYFNEEIVRQTKSNVKRYGMGRKILVAGNVSCSGLDIKSKDTKIGYLNYSSDRHKISERIDIYTEQISLLKKSQVDIILAETLISLADARAVVIASKNLSMPVIVSFAGKCDKNGVCSGKNLSDESLFSCLMTLQAMGADGFGVNCIPYSDDKGQTVSELAPYSNIPLMFEPGVDENNVITPNNFANNMLQSVMSGVSIVGGCCGTNRNYIAKIKQAVESNSSMVPSFKKEFHKAVATTPTQHYFLTDNLHPSELIPCDMNLKETLIGFDEKRVSVARVQLTSREDAHLLATEGECSNLPIMLYSNERDVLEEALQCFNGLLLVDSNCELDKVDFDYFSKRYGAIIY